MRPPITTHAAQPGQAIAVLRRTLMLRVLIASGLTQREAAAEVGTSTSTVSRSLRRELRLESVRPDVLLVAAAPALVLLAENHGYRRLAVFGSVARGEARDDSDIDLLIDPPSGTSSFDFLRFKQLVEEIIGRPVDLISYGGLRPDLDRDVLHAAVLL